MVLSNKKLKQKLRAAVSDSIKESVAVKKTPNSNPQSLKELIDSATHKPRLSKREKRRNKLPETFEKKKEESVGVEKAGSYKEAIEQDELKNKKKRKSNDRVSSGGVPESEENVEAVKKSKREKRRNKLPESSEKKKEESVGVAKAGSGKEAIGEDESKNMKKRKRNDQVSSVGVPESKENVEAVKKSNKKKKKKKRKKSKGKGKVAKSEAEEEKAIENGGEQSRLTEAATAAKRYCFCSTY